MSNHQITNKVIKKLQTKHKKSKIVFVLILVRLPDYCLCKCLSVHVGVDVCVLMWLCVRGCVCGCLLTDACCGHGCVLNL